MASNQAFDMTADPDEFVEAVAEFSKRRIITRDEADKLEDYAKRRAWWISGVAQMDVLNDVHESIRDALRKGTPFEEWQKQIGPKLEKAWGRKDSARILTIFRNATTQAYNAGRWQQMNEPHIAAARPFVEYDVVNDERTTEHICRPLIGVVVPLDSPFLRTRNPPLHHRCRTGLRTLRRRVAERKGITKDLPDVDATPGFGAPPDLAEPPKPSERETPPDPALALENAVKAGKDLKKRRGVKVKLEPKLTPEYWEEHYREKYGEAAKQIGYGRALLEQAKGMSAKDALEIVEKLEREKVPGVPIMAIDWLTDAVKFPRRVAVDGVLKEKLEAAKLLAQMAKLHGSTPVPLENVPHDLKYAAEKAQHWLSVFASPRLNIPRVKWRVLDESRKGRAFCDVLTNEINIDRSNAPFQAVHEWAHAIEYSGKLGSTVAPFRRAREAGLSVRLLRDITGDPAYNDEIAIEDKYWHPYMGKDYGDPNVSEVVSQLFGDLAGNQIAPMLREDPESLFFAIGLLGIGAS